MSQPMDFEAGKKCLLEIADILDNISVPFFLMQGTALGAYRDKGFTPTERDIDFGILYEIFRDAAPLMCHQFVAHHFEIETIHRPFGPCRTLVVKKHGWKADLVSFAVWKEDRWASAPIDPVNVPKPYCIVHPRERFETYEQVELFGKVFDVPSPIEGYLEAEYGPDWRTPKEDHISRTRVYDYLTKNGIPDGYLK